MDSRRARTLHPKAYMATSQRMRHYGGKIAADWMLDYTGCHLNTAILGGSVVTPHVLAAAGTKAEIQKLCGSSCKSQFVNLDLSQLVTEAQQQAQQVLRRDPSINVMYPQFDGAVPFVIAGLKQAGDQSKVKLISADGTPQSIAYIRSGTSPQLADWSLPPGGLRGLGRHGSDPAWNGRYRSRLRCAADSAAGHFEYRNAGDEFVPQLQ